MTQTNRSYSTFITFETANLTPRTLLEGEGLKEKEGEEI